MTEAHAQIDLGMAGGHVEFSYKPYWIAWLCLLAITLAMVFIGNQAVLIVGMALKATIIGAWFMHLRYERLDFVLCVALGILATSLVLFFLIAPDGRAM